MKPTFRKTLLVTALALALIAPAGASGQPARADEAFQYNWQLRNFLGTMAGLFLPNHGEGSLTFKGLVLVRGRTSVSSDNETTLTGNATFYGSMWTNDLNLTVGGSAIAYYSSDALALANLVGGGGALPAPLVVTSIADCAAVPSGSGGCP